MTPDDRLDRLVQVLRSGARLPRHLIDEVLAGAGKDADYLVDILHVGPGQQSAQPGDPCECGGAVVVRTSRRVGGYQVQSLRCAQCGRFAGRRVVQGATIRRRRKPVVVTTQARRPKGAQRVR